MRSTSWFLRSDLVPRRAAQQASSTRMVRCSAEPDRPQGYRRLFMSQIVDEGVASCPACGEAAQYATEETDDGRLDSIVMCPPCGEVRLAPPSAVSAAAPLRAKC